MSREMLGNCILYHFMVNNDEIKINKIIMMRKMNFCRETFSERIKFSPKKEDEHGGFQFRQRRAQPFVCHVNQLIASTNSYIYVG